MPQGEMEATRAMNRWIIQGVSMRCHCAADVELPLAQFPSTGPKIMVKAFEITNYTKQ